MTRIIGVISGKGGVGKTTTVANLGVGLIERGKSVIILDANVTTPNLSLHLGIPFYPITLHDVLKKKIHPSMAIYEHPSGLRIVPASLSSQAIKGLKMDKFENILLNLLGQAEIIIVDAAAGLGREALATIDVADELIVVTNPELPAVTDALKTIKIAEENGTKVLGVIVNRVSGHKHELSNKEISSMLDTPIIATIPEDLSIPESIAMKTPVVHYKPNSQASKEFKKLAAKVLGERFIERKEKNWFERLFSWLA